MASQPQPLRPPVEPRVTRPVDDVRIREIKELSPPAHLLREFPLSARAEDLVYDTRQSIHRILHGADDRLVVVIGPCSVHDVAAAKEYASRLQAERAASRRGPADRDARVLREAAHHRRLEGADQRSAPRRQLRRSTRACASRASCCSTSTRWACPPAPSSSTRITPQYIADLVSWGAIGARTTESQVHRQLASGLSCRSASRTAPTATSSIAVDAIKAASSPHHFLSITKGGISAIVSTNGNEDCHVILRGGKEPNYDAASVDAACRTLGAAGLAAAPDDRLLATPTAARTTRASAWWRDDVAAQVAAGDERIFGVMVESHLREGRQDLVAGQELVYGQSVTDACLGWDDSVALLDRLAAAVRARRLKRAAE